MAAYGHRLSWLKLTMFVCMWVLMVHNVSVWVNALSEACFTAVCLSSLCSQTLDRSCEESIKTQSNGGLVLLHFASWEVLIGAFFFRGEEKRKTTPLQLMNAFGDRKITTDIERQITCFYCAHVWMKNRCLSSLSFIIVCGHSNMAAKQSTLLKSLLSAKPCSWHPSTTGYQSKCITMNILGVMLEFTGTWVGSKCNVLLC